MMGGRRADRPRTAKRARIVADRTHEALVAAPLLIAAVLRGEKPAWPSATDDADAAAFVAVARAQGVAPLLDAAWHDRRTGPDWPEPIRQACHADTVAEAAREMLRRAELHRVLAGLAEAGVRSLLMKGTALAWTHYANPALRTRADCDVLVPPVACDAGMRVLRDLGYRRVGGPAGRYVGYQVEFHRDDPLGVMHNIDLHWRISNAQSFAWLFSFGELAAKSVPVPGLGPNARRLGDAHALILALLHRAGNNRFVEPGFGDRLIWLYDMLLLADAMSDDERSRFLQFADDAGIIAIAIDGLRHCADAFRSPRVDALVADLQRSPRANSGAAFLRSGKLALEWLELHAIPTNSARLGYLAGRLLPRADYMRERFPNAPNRALPLLHAQRWAEGVARRWSAHRR